MTTDHMEQRSRWRLILGQSAEEKLQPPGSGPLLNEEQALMDQALAAIYDGTQGEAVQSSGKSASRGAGLGKSAPSLAKWLGDIRTFFPMDVVSVIQADAIERKGLKELLFEPETLAKVKPDIRMVSTLLSLKGQIPEKTKETARQFIRTVVEDITRRLATDLRRAVTGAINRRRHTPLPSISGMDWKRTIDRNLKHYNQERKTIIPERFYFFDRARRSKEWTVILDIDQSGSMADSVIYASVIGSIFASMPSLETRVVVFDTEVVDLTEQCADDPVDMLFGIQLGGGTDINKSVQYCQTFIKEPKKSLFILISDLYEGGNQAQMLRRLTDMHEAGVTVICLLALSDNGVPFYDEHNAKKLAQQGIPCFGCTPDRLPELIEAALKGHDLMTFTQTAGNKAK
ncbi:hypothetical protein FHS18_004131 [Paenibacillus phyllosphaerae]|uniref:VWA domain containing CoxE-like protein n=1 Tax=Paenibacillus phyllosphaerae TaxID=274593 RepID=A0A7W5B098_9BACL|nr:VWA domain-containing protein [Paenibacillus phyllosphaerae]MBB3112053.1 hypothetical protein [Paenibacillus phyllosphaerae]